MKSENDRHMHQGTLVFVDGNHIRTEWLMYENGQKTYTASFDLVRKRK